VPGDEDRDVCLVVNDFGRRGRAYCETDVEATDLETVIQDLLDGQYSKPVRVVSFNTAEGWSRDISTDVAEELRRRCDLQMRDRHGQAAVARSLRHRGAQLHPYRKSLSSAGIDFH
jgi:hypothetical protein